MRVHNGIKTHKVCHCLPCAAVPRMSSVCKNLLKHENACLSFRTNKSSCTVKKKKVHKVIIFKLILSRDTKQMRRTKYSTVLSANKIP